VTADTTARADDLLVTLPDTEWAELAAPLPQGVRTAVWDVRGHPRDVLGDDADAVRAVVLPYSTAASPEGFAALAELPRLQLVQALSAGVDNLVGALPEGLPLANAAGVHDASTSELAVGLVLASLRGIDAAVKDAEQGRWRPVHRRALADSRVLLLGTGGIGGAIAARLRPFEVDLVRVASHARTDDLGPVHGVGELPDLLPTCDVVVLALPLTDATRGIVDADFLAAMPGQSLLVNVGRGPLVDTGALLAELRKERLHAALDVVDPEPLPQRHPLWGAPNLLLTPHVGGAVEGFPARAYALVRDQLARWAGGEPLINIVENGY
jgi:phosphoglycerate dehydrogenase-like enzyme